MKWKHPSVVKLIEEYRRHNRKDLYPEEIIREKARRLVRYALDQGWHGPPFDPYILAGLIGIRIIPAELSPSIEAMIVPEEEGHLKILLNSSVPYPERQNFSICHEIAHTFFPDYTEFIKMRANRLAPSDPDSEIETLCNIAASELLLPEDYFRESLKRYSFSLTSVNALSDIYRASKTATIIRMVGMGVKICAAVFLELGYRKSERHRNREVIPKMRVTYSIPSPGFEYYIPRNKSVPDDSCVYLAIKCNEITRGVEDWKIPGHPIYSVEAMSLPPLMESDTTQRGVVLLEPCLISRDRNRR